MFYLKRCCFLTLTCLLIIVPMLSDYYGIICIKLVNLFVPERATRGSDVELKCIYGLESDSLYALKWHFNGREFYRYAPKSNPNVIIFNVTGTKVNREKSNQGIIVLSNVNLNSTGRYKCEISAEATFQTIEKEAVMRVSANSGKSLLSSYSSSSSNTWLYLVSFLLIICQNFPAFIQISTQLMFYIMINFVLQSSSHLNLNLNLNHRYSIL